MVNTFITQSDIRQAVKDLDNRRLGKQRVEAQQILDKLLDYKAIIEKYNYDISTLTEGKMSKECNIFKNVFKKYTKEQRKLYFNGEYTFEPKGRKVSNGFAYHPMTLAWIGYEGALKIYINFCIQEWVLRGFENTMTFYSHIQSEEFPWWCFSYTTHLSHRSALLRKEKVRKEKVWYWNMPHIKEGVIDTEWYKLGYVWIVNLPLNIQERLKNGEIYPPNIVCTKQMNDFT